VKISRRRILITALIVTISAVVLLAITGPILARIYEQKIKTRLEASGIRIGSWSVNLLTRSITLRNVDWEQDQRKAHIDNISVKGIGILPYLKKKEIVINRILLENGTISITQDTVERKVQADSINLKGIYVNRLTFDNFDISIKNDTTTEYHAKVGIAIHFLGINPKALRDPASYQFKNIETTVQKLKIQKIGSLYAFTIKEATFDRERMILHIDSLKLEPLLNKNDFAKKVKSQETRLTLTIASVNARGVNAGVHLEDTAIMVSSIQIKGANIHAYKNKKYPFTRTKKFPLPMVSFQSLKFGIEVDTVKISESTITYEELPTEGFHTARITFEGVEATMNSVNNREFKNLSGFSTLEASAHLMKTGTVKATFRLPLKAKEKYSAEGTIKNVPLKELNPMLKDLAFIEIASGRLNKLDFKFTYDDIGSKGELRFDYEDLKILGLKKAAEKDVDKFKTLLVNTAVKNDQTLTGPIDVQRNQKKAVFNLWAASIANGIRNGLLPGKQSRKKAK
jgi:hypothetical protein